MGGKKKEKQNGQERQGLEEENVVRVRSRKSVGESKKKTAREGKQRVNSGGGKSERDRRSRVAFGCTRGRTKRGKLREGKVK